MANKPNAHQKKAQYGSMKRLPAWLIVAAVLLLATSAAVYTYFWSGERLSIFTEIQSDSKLQNYCVVASGERTYLGTYKDAVVALDREGKAVWTFPTSGAVAGIATDETRDWVIAGTQGRYIYILNAADGALMREIKLSGVVKALDYLPEKGLILVSEPGNAAKGVLSMYDIEGERILKISGRPTNGVTFAPDGESFYAVDVRANVYRYALDGTELNAIRLDNELYAVAVARDTGDVVTISDSGVLTRLDANLNVIMSVTLTGNGRSCAVTDDGLMTGVGMREGDFYLLDSAGGTVFHTQLKNVVQQIVINGDKGFIVPWNEQLFSLDVTAAEKLETYTMLRSLMYTVMFILPALFLIALILAFGKSRSRFLSFFHALKKHRIAYLMLLPTFALILVFNYYPIGQAFYYAFTDWSYTTRTMREVNFIGFDNFVKMVQEGYFLLGIKNLLRMMLCSFLKLLMPLFIAELVFAMSGGKRRYWFRFLLVLPMVVPGVVSTLMWKNIYDPNIGLINQLLIALGRTDLTRSWLGSEATALNAIIFMGFPWVNSFAFLVFYGGLINIPGDLFEAARVDGSNPIWNLTRIHLPLILPQIKMIVIMTFIASIQDYGGVLLLTEGGPGYATYVPGYELYLNATKLGQFGYACALGLVMFVVILGGTILNLKLKTEEALG